MLMLSIQQTSGREQLAIMFSVGSLLSVPTRHVIPILQSCDIYSPVIYIYSPVIWHLFPSHLFSRTMHWSFDKMVSCFTLRTNMLAMASFILHNHKKHACTMSLSKSFSVHTFNCWGSLFAVCIQVSCLLQLFSVIMECLRGQRSDDRI